MRLTIAHLCYRLEFTAPFYVASFWFALAHFVGFVEALLLFIRLSAST